MKLHEIIETNETGKTAILTEELYKYRNSLLVYYRSLWARQEPVLLITSVFNACQYALIVPECEIMEAIECYLEDSGLTAEEKENAAEEILCNSIPLYNF